MIGFVDVGGGLRDVYGAGVLDYCLENNIEFSYYIGVSAGSANIATFLAGQKGRTLRFYRDYAMRKEYMSFKNFIKTGSYIDLDYVYSVLSNYGGEDPLDYDEIMKKNSKFYVVVTDAEKGVPEYFDFSLASRNDYAFFKGSCCIPIACKPYEIDGKKYFDGGISDPVPIKKALDDGCDKVVIVLTRPVEYRKPHRVKPSLYEIMLREYPKSAMLMDDSIDRYNDGIESIMQLEKEGKVLIIAPDDCCGVETLTRNREAIVKLYEKGFSDGAKIKEFLAIE